jgi:ribosomal-protein-alanine N-acetyltransferase
MMPPLTTARLDLRPCALGDVAVLTALWREPDVRRYLWDDEIVSDELATEVVQAFLASADQRGYGLWLLLRRSGGELLGFAAMRDIAGSSQLVGSPQVELIYGLAPAAWGQGLATEAARAVLAYGLETLGHEQIWARTDPPNLASQRVIERLGMHAAENPGIEPSPMLSFVIKRSG